MGHPIPKSGSLVLIDGELVAVKPGGEVCGRFFVGPDGVVFEGELTVWQDEDPPKVRLASSYGSWRGGLGIVSFNIVRPDGKQDEVAWMRGAVGEDAVPGEAIGQFDLYTRARGQAEPSHGLIVSDAYSERSGERRTRVLMAPDGLKEFT